MEAYHKVADYIGYNYIVPLSAILRTYVEGPNAPVEETWNVRHVPEKTTPGFDLQCIGIVLVIATIFSLLEPLTRRFVTVPLCRKLCGPKTEPKDLLRFAESCWQLLYYAISWSYCVYIVLEAPYFDKTYLAREAPFPNLEMGWKEWSMYILQISWYAHQLLFLVLYNIKMKDFFVLLAHHIVTLALLIGSMNSGDFRYGILVLFSLDGCDIFLHLVKNTRLYDKYNPQIWSINVLGLSVYALLVATWFMLRIVFFAFKVLYASGPQLIHYKGYVNSDYVLFFNALLWAIYMMQLYWFYLILLPAYKHICYGSVWDDLRDPIMQARNALRKPKVAPSPPTPQKSQKRNSPPRPASPTATQ